MTATARTEMELKFSATGAYSVTLESENKTDPKTISFAIEGTGTTGSEALSKAVQAINEQSSKTGVVASLNKDATGIVVPCYGQYDRGGQDSRSQRRRHHSEEAGRQG